MEEDFTVEKYNQAFRQFRNYVRSYPSEELIDTCINHINAPNLSKIEQLQLQPWSFVLLIKWILVDPLCKKVGKKPLDSKHFNKIIQSLDTLMNQARLPDDFENHILFIRAIGAQQFPYQQDLSSQFIARQSILFSQLSSNHSISTDFLSHTGISISDFLDLSFLTFVLMEHYETSKIKLTWFQQFHSSYNEPLISKYINLISKTFEEMRVWAMLPDNKGYRAPSEVFEPSVLSAFPFIKTSTQLICIHPQLFYRSIENFVYDSLRQVNKDRFMRKFGNIFENYVNDGLQRAGLHFIRENEIMQQYGNTGLQIDFLTETPESNVFIECKAGEMPRQAITAHNQDIIADKTRKTALKAIHQAHDVLNKMSDIQKAKNNYLVVVTYKEMFIGNGRKLHNYMAKDAVDEIINAYNTSALIPMENIYFIYINDFDFLCEMIKNNTIGLVEAIERAKQADSIPNTSNFIFSQHLMDWWDDDKPEHLTNEFDQILQKIIAKLKLPGNQLQ